MQKRSRPVRANTLTQFEHPAQQVQKRSRPVRANPLTQFEHPGPPVQEKEPYRQGEPACGSSCAQVNRCRKVPGSTQMCIRDRCVAYGTGNCLENLSKMQDGTMNLSRQRQMKAR